MRIRVQQMRRSAGPKKENCDGMSHVYAQRPNKPRAARLVLQDHPEYQFGSALMIKSYDYILVVRLH